MDNRLIHQRASRAQEIKRTPHFRGDHMYGLKTGVDLTFLQGRELIQLAIGKHQVIFNFDEDVSVSVEGRFEYTSRSGSSEWQPGGLIVAASAVHLLGERIVGVQGREDGTLKLTFSNDDCLLILDTSTEYESYQISRRGEIIVV
jgi:hypothetical protein